MPSPSRVTPRAKQIAQNVNAGRTPGSHAKIKQADVQRVLDAAGDSGITDEEFQCLLRLLMAEPVMSALDHDTYNPLQQFAERVALSRGYDSWIDAHHLLVAP